MEQVLKVRGLCKEYPGFKLNEVGFELEEGTIMGFIGRNGAGKTTTIKSLLNLIHSDAGDITFFGLNFREHEDEIKKQIGYATGGISYYHRKKIKDIVAVTKSFYSNWDDDKYHYYLDKFSLDENKKLKDLSEGMKVKFNLTIALSHHARLLILDEPTSGLDPVSREELLEVFINIAREGVAILFSTHITSDLEKCADMVTYIKKGNILSSKNIEEFREDYRFFVVDNESVTDIQKQKIIGIRVNKSGDTAMIHKDDIDEFSEFVLSVPDLETIMVHMEVV